MKYFYVAFGKVMYYFNKPSNKPEKSILFYDIEKNVNFCLTL